MKLIRDINEWEEEIKKLTKEVETATKNSNVNMTPDELRRQLVTTNLSVTGKMELYNACVSGKLTDFRNLILNKQYPILEEIFRKKLWLDHFGLPNRKREVQHGHDAEVK